MMGTTMGGQAMCIAGDEVVVEVALLGDDRREAVCKRSAQRAIASEGARDTRPKGRDRVAGSAGQPGRKATRPESLLHWTPLQATEPEAGQCNHHGHRGCVRTRCAAISRMCARSWMRIGPRGSSFKWTM